MALLGVLACFLFMVTVWVIPLSCIHFIESVIASHIQGKKEKGGIAVTVQKEGTVGQRFCCADC